MKKFICKCKGVAVLLTVVLVVSLVTNVRVQAAGGAQTIESSGKAYLDNFFYNNQEIGLNSTTVVNIENYVKGATYSFTSSNKKIVSVKLIGKKATITANKYGKATITCKQKYKGKTSTLEKSTITVKKSSLVKGYEPIYVVIGEQQIREGGEEDGCPWVLCRNEKAKYQFTSDSDDFEVKEEKGEASKVFGNNYMVYNAKKAGTYKVTVKETYKGNTTTLGSYNVVVHNAEVTKEVAVKMGSSVYISNIINYNSIIKYASKSSSYTFKEDVSGIVNLEKDEYVNEQYTALKVGTTNITVYQDGVEIGKCKITVTDSPSE